MGTFSGTGLPPIVRVGDSSDMMFGTLCGTDLARVPSTFAPQLHFVNVELPVVKSPRKTVVLRKSRKVGRVK